MLLYYFCFISTHSIIVKYEFQHTHPNERIRTVCGLKLGKPFLSTAATVDVISVSLLPIQTRKKTCAELQTILRILTRIVNTFLNIYTCIKVQKNDPITLFSRLLSEIISVKQLKWAMVNDRVNQIPFMPSALYQHHAEIIFLCTTIYVRKNMCVLILLLLLLFFHSCLFFIQTLFFRIVLALAMCDIIFFPWNFDCLWPNITVFRSAIGTFMMIVIISPYPATNKPNKNANYDELLRNIDDNSFFSTFFLSIRKKCCISNNYSANE